MADQVSISVPPTEAPKEHPEGEIIRQKVEYYFSDENLPHDAHMLGLTGGAENLPVSISRIFGFFEMRKYKPMSQIRASLRKSTFLEFTDNKHIKRRVPLAIAPTVEPEVIEDVKRKTAEARQQDKQAKQQVDQDGPRLSKAMVSWLNANHRQALTQAARTHWL